MASMASAPLTYDQWVRRGTTTEAVPPNSDGVLHVGERAALVEQLAYLKKRNAQLMKQQRAVLLAACEAQAAHAACADFAGQLMRTAVMEEKQDDEEKKQEEDEDETKTAEVPTKAEQPDQEAAKAGMFCLPKTRRTKRRPVAEVSTTPASSTVEEEDEAAAKMNEQLGRLAKENEELLRKTAVLVDYVRATAPVPRGHSAYATTGAEEADLLSEEENSDSDDDDLPTRSSRIKAGCLPEPRRFDDFANGLPRCKWDAFVSGVVSAFGSSVSTIEDDD